MNTKLYRVCNFCEAMYGTEVQLTHQEDVVQPEIVVKEMRTIPSVKAACVSESAGAQCLSV